ncbi:MAG: alanine--tRNA ligase [Candidatus Moranbacteria bacterium]|nr:alanine--tRNA ligase [Candidatus Moranbacteria bacterium]
MTAQEIRRKYLEFFESKGHTIIPSDSLIPQNDPTTLFTTAGMHPLVPYIMGENHPGGKRVANVQKCIRTTDIEEVGDTTHHTFFEMLGNWSFGDYFKKEAIEWSWEFLTSDQWLGLDKKRIAVSVFAGDEDAPFDKEAFDVWKNLGISEERIAKLPKKQNWWGPAGQTGPCGPDTEIFYWVGNPDKVPKSFNDDHDNWVEIWNNVFMQFEKSKEGKYVPLKQKNVDTGMGFERIVAVMCGMSDNYETELFMNLIKKIESLSRKSYGNLENHTRSMRIIADHIKAAVFIVGDDKGIAPSNTDQGYVVRRLIRRAILHGKKMGIEEQNWTSLLAQVAINDYKNIYEELERNEKFILSAIEDEENKFIKTLEKGLRELDRIAVEVSLDDKEFAEKKIAMLQRGIILRKLTGKSIFDLRTVYGFPHEMVEEVAQERELVIPQREWDEANRLFEDHQKLSRTASAGKFKGGLADAGEETRKLHTAAHLMLAALRKVLGDHVSQKGSNITAERLRFDFAHGEKLTDEQKEQVENLVNNAIEKNFPITVTEMSVDEAKEKGAVGVFDSKYDEKVKVYHIGDGDETFSYEICGGPHVTNTKELGKFRIKKEQSSGAGVRRIKAVLVEES